MRPIGQIVIPHRYIVPRVPGAYLRSLDSFRPLWPDCSDLYRSIMWRNDYGRNLPMLAKELESSMIFPASLVDAALKLDKLCLFMLVDGQILLNNRYHDEIRASDGISPERETHYQLKDTPKPGMIPCAASAHADLQFSFFEYWSYLELRADLFASGQVIRLNWHDIIIASMGIVDGSACDHHLMSQVQDEKLDKIWETSIITPVAPDKKIAIVQTYKNPTAQLVACCLGVSPLLQRLCCLNCAIDEALELNLKMIIVAC